MKRTANVKSDLPVIAFERPADWEAWLEEHHAESPGVWLRLAKKGSGLASVTHDEALEAALCFGWIDGQKKSCDDETWLQKFTPRGPQSVWSQVNQEKVARLTASGRMRPAGLQAVERARQNGRWEAAYERQKGAVVPADFLAELDKNPAAKEFFATLNSQNRYAIVFRLQTAKKPETRARRIRSFIEMLERKEKFH
ncbi:MAG TPA: YdeI/OmpD-associated family protein [Thermoanaerobaculia bacterium]|nr:YdeI/OmpD-associated family protein [Thermoanaerobaculia bacterium]